MQETVTSFFRSEFAEKLGNSLIFLIIAWLVWQQMNLHINGRLESQDKQIQELSASVAFLRDYAAEEQQHRSTIFTGIARHLEDIASNHSQRD